MITTLIVIAADCFLPPFWTGLVSGYILGTHLRTNRLLAAEDVLEIVEAVE